jgi:hypothetical protein
MFRIMPDEIVLHIAEFLPTVNIHFLKFMFQCLRYTYRTCYDSVTAARSAALHNQTDLAMKIVKHCGLLPYAISAEMIVNGYREHCTCFGAHIRYCDTDYATALMYTRDESKVVEMHVRDVYQNVEIPECVITSIICMDMHQSYKLCRYNPNHLVLACKVGSKKIIKYMYVMGTFNTADAYFMLKNIVMTSETMLFIITLLRNPSSLDAARKSVDWKPRLFSTVQVPTGRSLVRSIYIADDANYLHMLCNLYSPALIMSTVEDHMDILYAANNSDLAIAAHNYLKLALPQTSRHASCQKYCSNKNIVIMLEKELITYASVARSAAKVGDMYVLNYIREHDPDWERTLCDAVGVEICACTKRIKHTRAYYLALWLSYHGVSYQKLRRYLHHTRFRKTIKKIWRFKDTWVDGLVSSELYGQVLWDNPHRENGAFSDEMSCLLHEMNVSML